MREVVDLPPGEAEGADVRRESPCRHASRQRAVVFFFLGQIQQIKSALLSGPNTRVIFF
jgi:hypothetical protein